MGPHNLLLQYDERLFRPEQKDQTFRHHTGFTACTLPVNP